MTYRQFDQLTRGDVRLLYTLQGDGWLGIDVLRQGKPDFALMRFARHALQLEDSPPFADADWATFLANRGIGGGGGSINLTAYVKKTELEAELLKLYTKAEVDDLLALLEQSLKDVLTIAMQGAVQVSDKATISNVASGVMDRWVDAATLNGYTFSRGEIAAEDQKLQDQITDLTTNLLSQYAQTKDVVLRSMKATGADITAGTADRWIDAAELKLVLDLIVATEPQIATDARLGVVRVGAGLAITADGILSADAADVPAGMVNLLDGAAGSAVLADPGQAQPGDLVAFTAPLDLPASWTGISGKSVKAGDLALKQADGSWLLIAGDSSQELENKAQAAAQLLIDAYLNQLVKVGDMATPDQITAGAAGKWVDAANLRLLLGELTQYITNLFGIEKIDGSGTSVIAQPGWVYTLRTVSGAGGQPITTYGWEPLPVAGGGVTAAQLNDALAAYAKLSDINQVISAKELIAYNGTFNVVKGSELHFSGTAALGVQTKPEGPSGTLVNRLVLFRLDTADNQPIEPLAFSSDLNAYAKLTDLDAHAKLTDLEAHAKLTDLNAYAKLIDARQRIIADDVAVDLLRLQGDGQSIESYTWAMGVRPSFVTHGDRLMLAHDNEPDGIEVLTRTDGTDLLRVVQGWFVGAGLPSPTLPAAAVRGVAQSLRSVLPPQNRMAPEAIDEQIQGVVGGLMGRPLSGADLQLLSELVSAETWDGSDESLEAALPVIARAMAAGAAPADPLVHRSELAGLLNTGATGCQIRLRGVTGPAVALPAQAWSKLDAAFVAHVEGPWLDVANGEVLIPSDGQYELFVQALTTLASDAPQTELLVRVVGSAGVYSGDSGSTTVLGALLEHSSVIAAQAGDRLRIEAWAEGAGVLLWPQSLVLRLARVGDAAGREVWLAPPAPWSLPLAVDGREGQISLRRILLDLAAGELGTASGGPWRQQVTVRTEGGAVAALAPRDNRSGQAVMVGSQVGRLFKVSGRIAGASQALLTTTGNGTLNAEICGTSRGTPVANNPELVGFAAAIGATCSATRADFSKPLGGHIYGPDLVYVATSKTQLEVSTVGGNSSGGQVVLTDVTPAEWNGEVCAVLRADKEFIQAAPSSFWGLDLAAVGDATDLWVSDNPALCPVTKANGVGHRFRLNSMPNGIYRVQAVFTVTGEHKQAGWRPGWNANSFLKDSFLPSRREVKADGSVEYTMDVIYRLGNSDVATVGYWFSIVPTATSIGKPIKIVGETRLTRLPEGVSNFETVLPFTAGQPVPTAGGLALSFDGTQQRTGPGLLMMNYNGGFDPYQSEEPSWSGYGSITPYGPVLASTHGLTMNLPAANHVVNAKATLLVNGALTGAELRYRRVGSNYGSGALQNKGKQADGNFLYEVELKNLPGIDGGWYQNFLVLFVQAPVAGTKLVKGELTCSSAITQLPMP